MATLLKICGFQIPGRRGGGSTSHFDHGGSIVRDINGNPTQPSIAMVRDDDYQVPLVTYAKARAVQRLVSVDNGEHWACDNSVYSAAGTSLDTTPTFSTTEKKFGTHSISIGSGGSAVDVTSNLGSEWTVAAWVHEGTSFKHYVLDSDGNKYVDGTANAGATMPFSESDGTWTLDVPGSGTNYFDDLVVLNFVVWDTWPDDWPTDEAFSDLPDLTFSGDLVTPETHVGRASATVSSVGYIKQFSGQGATVSLRLVMGPKFTPTKSALQLLYESATVWLKFEESDVSASATISNDGAGGSTYDFTSNGFMTAQQSAPDINGIDQLVDYSVDVDGASSAGAGVKIDQATLDMGAKDYTCVVYFKNQATSGTSNRQCFYGSRASYAHTVFWRDSDDLFSNRVENNNTSFTNNGVTDSTFADGNWHRVCWHVEWGNRARVWLDGVEMTGMEVDISAGSAGSHDDGSENWFFGAGGYEALRGLMASAAIWYGTDDDTLTDAERASL